MSTRSRAKPWWGPRVPPPPPGYAKERDGDSYAAWRNAAPITVADVERADTIIDAAKRQFASNLHHYNAFMEMVHGSIKYAKNK